MEQRSTGGWTVGEVFAHLDDAAKAAGLDRLRVSGAVSGLSRRSRWASFELVEPGTSGAVSAKLRCVVLGAALRGVLDGSELVDGARVCVDGAFDVDANWGSVRLVVDRVVAVWGTDPSTEARDALVEALANDGLLTAQHSLVVPGRPVRVGLVTGIGTAGEADVMQLLERSGVELRLERASAPMTGPRAADAVAAAVRSLGARGLDLVVVARGGGARSDMGWADSEVVARAIATCGVPVWTAIGHATDTTVADLVANRSVPTPSAAAAAIVERVRAWEQNRHDRVTRQAHQERVTELRRRERRAWAVTALVAAAVVALVLMWLAAGR